MKLIKLLKVTIIASCVILMPFIITIEAEEMRENTVESKTGIKINSERLNSKDSVQGIKNQEKVFSKKMEQYIEIKKEHEIINTEQMVNGLFSGNDPYQEKVVIFADENEYKKQEIRYEKNHYSFLNYLVGIVVIVIGVYILFILIGGEEDGK